MYPATITYRPIYYPSVTIHYHPLFI